MASPIYLASLQLPLTEKPVMAFSAEQQLIYQDIFNLQNTFKIVLANFTEEAPDDGAAYVRQNKEWVAGGGGGGDGIPEAPVDGKIYGRKDATWVEVSGGSSGVPTITGHTVVVDSTSTTISVKVPATAAEGDLLILTGYARGLLTPPPGWSLVLSVPYASTTQHQYLITKRAAAGDAGSTVTLTQATSQRIGVTALSVSNARLGNVKTGTSLNSPVTVDAGQSTADGIALLSLGVLSQVTPGTLSCTNYSQLTPTSFDPLRNLTAFKPVSILESMDSVVTGGGDNYGWFVVNLIKD